MSRRDALLLTAVILLALILQTSVIPVFVRPSFKPDLLLVIMVFIALRTSFQIGAPLSWLIGILNDVTSGLYLGLQAASFLAVFMIIKNISDRLYADSAILFVLAVAGVTFACFTINLLMLVLFTASPGIAYSMITDLVPRILINSFVASLVTLFPGFDRNLEVP